MHIDGYLGVSSFHVNGFYSIIIGSSRNSSIWYHNRVTIATKERILVRIKIAYPSVSQIDHVLVVTWYNIGNPQFHNGKVSVGLYLR